MSRDRTRTRDRPKETVETDAFDASEFDIGSDDTGTTGERMAESGGSSGLRERTASRAKRLFSPRAFIAALLLSVVGLLTGNAFVPLPGSGVLGVFLATFVFGLVVSERRYAEAAVAGGLTVGMSALIDTAVLAFLGGFGVSLAVLGGGAGAVVGLLGTYFGRDLRDGLTRDI